MRGITLHEPWASLIAHGIKNWETRSWKTRYRGLLLIHSGQRFPKKHEVLHLRKSVIHPDAGRALSTDYKDNMGCIITIATLEDCILMTEELIDSTDETELFCGDWQPGRYAWKLADAQRIKPIPFKGKQGLWIPSPEVIAEVSRYVNAKSA
jgi:hypothetical protein